MKIRPLQDKVVVRFSEDGVEKTAGGLYIPDVAKEKPQQGVVEAVGPEVKEVKPGSTVLFDKYAGTKVKNEKYEYLIIKEESLLGIVE
ncbi:MAG: co-chaperone GroES [Nitrospirota bacterium]